MPLSPAQELRSKAVLYGGLFTINVCVAALVFLIASYHFETKEAFSENIAYREKAKLTSVMRESVYFRTYLLSYTPTIEDFFERDEERQNFNVHAQNMIRARNRLVAIGLSGQEKAYFDKMTEQIVPMRTFVDRAMDLAVEEPNSETFLTALREVRWRQLELQETLDAFAAYYDKVLEENSMALQTKDAKLWDRTVFVSVLLLVSALVVALYIVRSEAYTKQMLRDTVEEKTADLRVERDRADQANQFKSKFLATMSHELRTPLNAIIGFSDMIRSELVGPVSPPQYVDYARDIYNSGSYLLNLINEILDMSKVEAGEYKVFLEHVSLQDLVSDAAVMIEVMAQQKQLSVRNDIPSDLPLLMADPRVTKQIVINLLSNAVKFTPQGGEITLTANVSKGMAEVCIADNGPGLTPEDAKAVLEPFVQAQQDPGCDQQGTGLGLPLCKKFSELQGGTFRLDSEFGIGTKAMFAVPLAVQAEELGNNALSGGQASGRTTWLPSMSVGVQEWDAEHRTLLDLLARLPAAERDTMNADDFDAVLDELSFYMEGHLRSEEKAMQHFGYPGYEAHKAKHDQFRAWVEEKRKQHQTAPETCDCLEASRFIVNWWHFHIMKVDMDYKAFFEDKDVAGQLRDN